MLARLKVVVQAEVVEVVILRLWISVEQRFEFGKLVGFDRFFDELGQKVAKSVGVRLHSSPPFAWIR